LRSVAELSWALGREINFELRKPVEESGQNINTETTTIGWKQPTLVSMPGDTCVERKKARTDHFTMDDCPKDIRE